MIVEGYLDCIALHQAGITNAVASLGTAFTADQARELRKATENVFICFDGDAAGQAATSKSVDTLRRRGLGGAHRLAAGRAKIPTASCAPTAKPDSARSSRAAIPWVQFKIDRRIAEIQAGFKSRAQIAREAEILVRTLPRAEWDHWRTYAAPQLGVDIEDLRKARLQITEGAQRRIRRGPDDRRAPLRQDPAGLGRVAVMGNGVPCDLCLRAGARGEYARPHRARTLRRAVAAAHLQPHVASRRTRWCNRSDVFALFSDDGDVSATLASIAGSERSSIIRFADTETRRAQLERMIERFAADDRQRRFRELDAQIERLVRGRRARSAGTAGRTQRAARSENERMTPSPAYRNGEVQQTV